MNKLVDVKYSFSDYLPLFLVLCFSGNPLFISAGYSKPLLVAFCGLFIIYSLIYISAKEIRVVIARLALIISLVIVISIFQKFILGIVSYPGVFALILKIILGMFMLLYYQSKYMNPLDIYIRVMAFLAKVSLPFFALNFVINTGLPLDVPGQHSFFLYTSFDTPKIELRNAGMFWEPGAFAGYLLLALLFIGLLNRKFEIGSYKKQVIWIIVGLITSMSTTGFLVLAILILIYILQNYKIASIVLVPILIAGSIYAYNNLDFLNKKIEEQYDEALEMEATDVSNTRFGALNMDMQYIEDQPWTGNGLDMRTRYRFHPWISEDIGHGNGMSNFLVYWGIPLFVFWLFCLFQFGYKVSESIPTTIIFLLLMILILQGEQFLNFSIFLMFFSAPVIIYHRYDELYEEEETPLIVVS